MTIRTLLLGASLATATLAAPLAADARGAAPVLPLFRPEIYFAGHTHADGAFVDASGKPESRFVGDTTGRRDPDGSTTFRQAIRFDDGTRRDRTWRIVPVDAGHIVATGSDIVGFAQGEIAGNVLHLAYTVRTDPQNPLLDVEFEQTMTLQPDGRTLINRSTIRKFGFVVRRASERFVRLGRGRRGWA